MKPSVYLLGKTVKPVVISRHVYFVLLFTSAYAKVYKDLNSS